MQNKPLLRKAVIVLAAGAIALTAAACNTVKGAGRDIESVGDAAERAL